MVKIFSILLCALLIGCASSSAGISTSNVPIVNKKYTVIGPVEAKKGWLTLDMAIFAIPFDKPPINEMTDEMIKSKEADALINIRYWQDRSIYLIFTWNRLGINAEAIKFSEEPVKPEVNVKKPR
ncbi:MAG: hypothetical protein KBA66_01160 [Leptospiraceae bacterium]|nr:hypothetical protein [Leptospiraceae bacterium]